MAKSMHMSKRPYDYEQEHAKSDRGNPPWTVSSPKVIHPLKLFLDQATQLFRGYKNRLEPIV